jgi:hypothetical protein
MKLKLDYILFITNTYKIEPENFDAFVLRSSAGFRLNT